MAGDERFNLDGWEAVDSIEQLSADAHGVRIFVKRPAKTRAALEKLYAERPTADNGWKLTQGEKESGLLRDVAEDVMRLLRLQTARLDPATAQRIEAEKASFRDTFHSVGLAPIYMQVIPNEYWAKDSDYAYASPWYLVTTPLGHFKVGWRKRVINLDWSQTTLKADGLHEAKALMLFADENVTKGTEFIHAWGHEKLRRYLARLVEWQMAAFLTAAGVYPPPSVDAITAAQWRTLSKEARGELWRYWQRHGVLCFSCLGCGFPSRHGCASCEACENEAAEGGG